MSRWIGLGRYLSLVSSYVLVFHGAGHCLLTAQCVTPAPGMVSWWRAENDAKDSADSNNGTLSGGVGFVPGKVSAAFSFDGSSGAVTLSSPTNLASLTNFTIETWLRRKSSAVATFDGPDGHGHFWGFGRYGYSAFIDANGYIGLSKTGYEYVANTNRITDTNWHHVAISKSGASVLIYVDGVGYQTPAFDPGFLTSGQAMIGAIPFDSGYHLYGDVDELAIYNRALTGSEVTAIYNAGAAGKCSHRAPVAGNIFAATVQNRAIEITKDKILAYCSDPNGYALTVVGVSGTSTNGGSVTLGTASVSYAPVNGYLGPDQFNFTISDGTLTATGTVAVLVRSADTESSNMLSPVPVPGGFAVSFAGIPGHSYTLQRAPTVTGPWQSIATVLCGSNGIGSFTDTNAPPGAAFYRTTYP